MSTRFQNGPARTTIMTPTNIVVSDGGLMVNNAVTSMHSRRNATLNDNAWSVKNKRGATLHVSQNYDTSVTEGGDSIYLQETKLRQQNISPKLNFI